MVVRKGNFVYKENERLNDEWKEKFIYVMEYIHLPAFVRFIPGGYIAKYIDGFDLQEDTPFNPRHDIVRAFPLNERQRQRIISIWKDIVYAGIKTGYTLADFTKRNIIMKGDTPYLIDYDVIIEGPLNQDYIDIFQRMIDYLNIPYKFTGDLKELYANLN